MPSTPLPLLVASCAVLCVPAAGQYRVDLSAGTGQRVHRAERSFDGWYDAAGARGAVSLGDSAAEVFRPGVDRANIDRADIDRANVRRAAVPYDPATGYDVTGFSYDPGYGYRSTDAGQAAPRGGRVGGGGRINSGRQEAYAPRHRAGPTFDRWY